MEVAIQLPDDIGRLLQDHWGDEMPRHVLESFALECYRARILGESQLRRMLGFETRFEVHGFLKDHGIPFYTLDDLEHDRNTLRQLEV